VPKTFKIGELGGAEPSGAARSTWTDPKINVKDTRPRWLVVHWGGDWNEITAWYTGMKSG